MPPLKRLKSRASGRATVEERIVYFTLYYSGVSVVQKLQVTSSISPTSSKVAKTGSNTFFMISPVFLM